jgi:peroxiredoxin
MLATGDTAPDFTGHTDTGEESRLRSLRGSKVVSHFYPKDNSSG